MARVGIRYLIDRVGAAKAIIRKTRDGYVFLISDLSKMVRILVEALGSVMAEQLESPFFT